ncbi:PH domain-containing protein [Diaminobutyricibacter tongyongensis]|uniref:PH domain-containing protein n=1 Tax=Leifsonia tongyongensis TaxID=1268043 RepID=A0A6L9XZQ0_9MICO|nr:PH domain-containing protein [Diaminobutyricibacter tongyongensis]NEN06870.1 PH domain-containing protein [Diaminobutyricibacter tongyongensis]
MSTEAPSGRDVYTSRFNRILAVIIWALALFMTGSLLFVAPGLRLLYLFPAAFVALFAWEALWSPRVEVDDSGVRLRNVLRTVFVPWAALIHVDTKYSLTLYTPGHRYAAWAAPAPGRASSYRATKSRSGNSGSRAPLDGDAARPGDLLGTESGEAAYLVRSRWDRLRERGAFETGVADTTKVTVTTHWATAVALIVLAAGSVVAILVG